MQVACGMHHTVLLLQNGQVYTFGSNQHGQLGHGDLILRGSPTLVYSLPTVTQVAAGSNHSVFLTAWGRVYTCGSHQRGQLGRGPSPLGGDEGSGGGAVAGGSSRRRGSIGEGGHGALWHATPGPIPSIGVKRGRRATWVGASGDHTFVRLDEFLTSAASLAHCSLVANRSCVGELHPSGVGCLGGLGGSSAAGGSPHRAPFFLQRPVRGRGSGSVSAMISVSVYEI